MQKLTDEEARAQQEQEREALLTALQAEQNRQHKVRLDEEAEAERDALRAEVERLRDDNEHLRDKYKVVCLWANGLLNELQDKKAEEE